MESSFTSLTSTEIYESCRISSELSEFSASSPEPGLRPSATAREIYQGLTTPQYWWELSPTRVDTIGEIHDDGDGDGHGDYPIIPSAASPRTSLIWETESEYFSDQLRTPDYRWELSPTRVDTIGKVDDNGDSHGDGHCDYPIIPSAASPRTSLIWKIEPEFISDHGVHGYRRGMTVPEIGSLIGRAAVVGFEVAVDVLDVLGRTMSNFNPSSVFVSGMASRGNKISLLSFEVANTIVKGSNLLKSLSEENIQFLKKEILHSDGVQKLVSVDFEELLTVVATDKREELDVVAREVIRFGNLCIDPRWHQLDRCFQKLDSELMPHELLEEKVDETMQALITLAQNTSELYHELHVLDRYNQEEEEALRVKRRGEGLMYLRTEFKRQIKLIRSLKKKSLWTKNMEKVVEKLVDVVIFIHQRISEVFGIRSMTTKSLDNVPAQNPQRLGVSGLALHYANVIIQIDSIVCRPSYVPPNVRDTLYQALPVSVKAAIRSRLQTFQVKEELNASKIKVEMEKTLHWLVPIAQNTTKAYQTFGWVGEWANIGNEMNRKASGQNNIIRIQTLHHAQKDITDEYLLELVTWLHHLVSKVKQRDHGFRTSLPTSSPAQKGPLFSLLLQGRRDSSGVDKKSEKVNHLSIEEKQMPERVFHRKLVPGISKSQDLVVRSKSSFRGLTRRTGSSPVRKFGAVGPEKSRLLDVMDGLETLGGAFLV